jgi:HK97 gp10 family phage protein
MNIIKTAGFDELIHVATLELAKHLAEDVAAEARSNAPVRTGHLRDSISVEVDGDTVIVQASADYAGYVELGTRHQRAEPFLMPALMHERSGS